MCIGRWQKACGITGMKWWWFLTEMVGKTIPATYLCTALPTASCPPLHS